MGTTSRHATLIIRRFLWGQRCYTNGGHHAHQKVKISRFALWEAKIERILPKRLLPLYHHEAGLKSIFFWAPSWKWVLVIAGMADYTRPADKLSPRQGLALAVTGFIWARWSLVIIPKNWNLFSVNIFLGFTGCMQLARIYLYHRSQRHHSHGCPNKGIPCLNKGVPMHGIGKPGFIPDKQVHYLPPAAPPGTMMVYAPGVQPPVSLETSAMNATNKPVKHNK